MQPARKIVLVVDDDEATLEALCEVLTEAGYLVTTASNGQEALAMLEKADPADVAIVDLMMPVMDGWGFVSRLRADARFAETPIVVITAGGPAMLASAPVVGAYLTKPVKIDQLLQTLNRVITLRPSRRKSGIVPTPRYLTPTALSLEEEEDSAVGE